MYVTSPVNAVESEIAFQVLGQESDIHAGGRVMTIEEGENLFFAGDDADHVYEVIEGVVKTSKVLADGRRQVLNFCYPGEITGLSHDSLYHCDCDAVSRVKVRLHRRNAFMQNMVDDPEFCARLLNNAAEEINHMQDHFLMLGRKTAMEKLASFLVAILRRHRGTANQKTEFELPMKRSDIADFLGMTIETVSRNLTKLRKMQVIDMENPHRITVLKQGLLRELAENAI